MHNAGNVTNLTVHPDNPAITRPPQARAGRAVVRQGRPGGRARRLGQHRSRTATRSPSAGTWATARSSTQPRSRAHVQGTGLLPRRG